MESEGSKPYDLDIVISPLKLSPSLPKVVQVFKFFKPDFGNKLQVLEVIACVFELSLDSSNFSANFEIQFNFFYSVEEPFLYSCFSLFRCSSDG